MYQFYYSDTQKIQIPEYSHCISEVFQISSIRPTMWEEHCLECSAPSCYKSCVLFQVRRDGRCRRFNNGIAVRPEKNGCCGQAAHLTFRKWANLMTIILPGMMNPEEYLVLTEKNQRLGNCLRKIVTSRLPLGVKWAIIRGREYIRRRGLRGLSAQIRRPDAFVFHGFSYEPDPFQLFVEVYEGHTPRFKTALQLKPGENMLVLSRAQLDECCWTNGFLVKVYPENDREAELDILWCDFVCGEEIQREKPADKVKCVVWDLDNTLWDGILIETDNPETLKLRPGVETLIHFLDERGIIQSVASKNDYENTWPVIERLGLAEFFLYPQIHWGAKSSSLVQIAKSLNIGIDSLALVDDSVFERKQVASELPGVRCFAETEIDHVLSYPEFQTIVTEESRNRRAMYRAEEKRNELKADNHDTISFLKKCHLKLQLFEPKSDGEILRCFELSSRTNQLNMSGRRYSQEEFLRLLADPEKKSFAFSCRDDFGEYGIVGFGQYHKVDGILDVTEFAMSCRVAGKYVESALFAGLLEREGCSKGSMTVIKTKKNTLLRNTLEELGFITKEEKIELVRYWFDMNLRHREIATMEFK